MREKLLAFALAVWSLVQAVNHWLGRQAYKTLAEIDEFGFATLLEKEVAKRDPEALAQLQEDNRGQLGFSTILAAVVVVITVFLGVVIVDQMDQSLGTPGDSNLSDAQNDTLSGFADMTSLVAPLLLVAIAVVIIGLLRRVN